MFRRILYVTTATASVHYFAFARVMFHSEIASRLGDRLSVLAFFGICDDNRRESAVNRALDGSTYPG
jgi:hypothetical protein